jgi:hypothetical protein
VEAGARRVNQHDVGGCAQHREHIFGWSLIEFHILELVQVDSEILAGRGGGFDAGQPFDVRGDEGAEQPDAAVDIQQSVRWRER